MNIYIINLIQKLLNQYSSASKLGPDFITEEKHFHPMSEGKYLSACAVLFKHGLIERSALKKNIDDSVDILKKHNLSKIKKHMLYGLGFEWLDRPRNEPYLITSSICTRGLMDMAIICEHDGLSQLLTRSLDGLFHWLMGDNIKTNEGFLPSYSPHVRVPVYNPAAHCCTTLLQASKHGMFTNKIDKRIAEIFSIVDNAIVKNVGWRYSAYRGVSDLVHISYIFGLYNEILPTEEAEKMFMALSGQYYINGSLYERARVIENYDEIKLGRGSFQSCVVRHSDGVWFALDDELARLWAIGEFLVIASQYAKTGKQSWYWRMLIHNILNNFECYASTSHEAEKTYSRAVMHMVHGLVCVLPVLDTEKKYETLSGSF